jgi:hypothetical protein
MSGLRKNSQNVARPRSAKAGSGTPWPESRKFKLPKGPLHNTIELTPEQMQQLALVPGQIIEMKVVYMKEFSFPLMISDGNSDN